MVYCNSKSHIMMNVFIMAQVEKDVLVVLEVHV